ncbi:PP2C family protein-serine/threonine phosphatase [Streptomyces sp. NPDC050145]|uniref:PP2C family protein-serine/threonine phosphatase n=1 Tax=Streptomyces sp. NPDC050145 TaxID=3365602 RepID=UPI00379FE801
MRHHAIAKHIGGRSRQCDATAVVAAPNGVRAYALLDGVGSTAEVARWTRGAAHRVAALAARHRNAEAGLRAAYDHYAAREEPDSPFAPQLPHAAAVVAVSAPGKALSVAWCGDARAYLWAGPGVARLTDDHNHRRAHPPYGRANILTSCLGSSQTDAEVQLLHGHEAVESASRRLGKRGRLLLASDGAYEPIEESTLDLADLLVGALEDAADVTVATAVELWGTDADNATVLVADLFRGIHY